MKTIWVVEVGEYSDYRVVGVYTSEEGARKMAALVGGEVAEWPLDPRIDEINQGMSYWRVLMHKDGTVEEVESSEPSYTLDEQIRIWERTKSHFAHSLMRNKPDAMNAHVWATDEKHAVKIVNERRAEWIAMGKWPD